MTRVGIFGGSFDPPHRAHLRVAVAACDELALDALCWIPAAQSPHKVGQPMTPEHHRLGMITCMAAQDERFRVDTRELDAGGISWTVDTLRRIRSEHPDWDLTLIMGEDQVQSFPRWREPDAIRSLASLVAYRREGWEGVSDVEPDTWLRGEPVDMVATEIRDKTMTR